MVKNKNEDKSFIEDSSRYNRKRRRSPIEPLKRSPDYREQRKLGSMLKEAIDQQHVAALNVRRVYFVDEGYNQLLVTANGVDGGGDPKRFRGQIEYIPRKGDYIRTGETVPLDEDRYFKVVRVEHILYRAVNTIPKTIVVLQEVGSEEEL